MVRNLSLNKKYMRNKYITPAIYIIVPDTDFYFMSGSSDKGPEDLTTKEEIGNKVQLSKFHSVFDEQEDEDENDW